MRDEQLDAEVKARVPKSHKRELQKIARSRHLKASDILREALREKISGGNGGVKQEAAA